jgi:2-polyprenyl-3-methyl-5-hydroxy-6-metoxy-1,4-benzoquinol methylase
MTLDHGRLTDNERWYVALTARWARRMRAGLSAPGTERPAGPDVTFAETVMGLTPKDRILDLACAWGRTTLELARRGYAATGLDISPDLLCIARERAAASGLDIAFVEGTVRSLPAIGPFDAVTEFYDDSVISFEDESNNLSALRSVARRLRPGGTFLFGTSDYPGTMPAYRRVHRIEMDEDIVEEILFDASRMTGTSVRVHRVASASTTYRRVRRHYTPGEVASLLERAGMRLVGAWSGYDTKLPYGARPQGMVVLAERVDRPATEGR